MRYEGDIYRPPSEANSYILQATIGCSWNHCTYCDMYREKRFRVRPLEETLADVAEAGLRPNPSIAVDREEVFSGSTGLDDNFVRLAWPIDSRRESAAVAAAQTSLRSSRSSR